MSNKFDFIHGKIHDIKFKKENLSRCEYVSQSNIDFGQKNVCGKPASVKYTTSDGEIFYLCDKCDEIINGVAMPESTLNKKIAKDVALDSGSKNRWIVHEGFVFDRDRNSSVALLSSKGKQSPFPKDIAEKLAEMLNLRWSDTTFSPTNYEKVIRRKW